MFRFLFACNFNAENASRVSVYFYASQSGFSLKFSHQDYGMSTRHLIKGKPADELENPPAKSSIRCCDVLILAISFLFTILVASLVVLYIKNNRHQSNEEIEKIVERILDDRIKRSSQDSYDGGRQKRAVNDQRFRSTGENFSHSFDLRKTKSFPFQQTSLS
jgi:hypothetical protein